MLCGDADGARVWARHGERAGDKKDGVPATAFPPQERTMIAAHALLLAPLVLLALAGSVEAHGNFGSAGELHRFQKRYALRHRAMVAKCGGRVQARRLRRALSPSSDMHPLRRSLLLQELTARQDNTTSSSNTTTSSCVLDGEVTQGPYHVLGELVRQNITEGLAGLPVTFDVDFVDYSTCEPLSNAWIDVWHANSTGACLAARSIPTSSPLPSCPQVSTAAIRPRVVPRPVVVERHRDQ